MRTIHPLHSLCWLAGLAALGVASAIPGCGGDSGETAATTSGSAGAGRSGAAGKSGTAGRAGHTLAGAAGSSAGNAGNAAGTGAPCGPPPPGAPPGWDEIAPGEWSCMLRMFRNPHPELTEPWEWTSACPPDAPSGVACELLVTPPLEGVPAVSFLTRGTDAAGDGVIAWSRYPSVDGAAGPIYQVIDPATGRPRLSVYRTYRANAQAIEASSLARGLDAGRAVFHLWGNGSEADPLSAGFGHGGRVVSIDPSFPTFTWKAPMVPLVLTDNFYVSALGLIRNDGSLALIPFDGGPERVIYSSAMDPQGLPGRLSAVSGAELVVAVGAAGISGYHSWSPTAGLRPLLRAPGDITKAWGALDSDGRDIVWTYGEGQPTDEYEYPKFTAYTAPWTTDPAELASKMRSLGDNTYGAHFGTKFLVGCGFAAQNTSVGADVKKGIYASVELIRLSTGERWIVKNNSKYGALDLYALTCEHLYVGVPGVKHVRIRLDSLGPSTPAPL